MADSGKLIGIYGEGTGKVWGIDARIWVSIAVFPRKGLHDFGDGSDLVKVERMFFSTTHNQADFLTSD